MLQCTFFLNGFLMTPHKKIKMRILILLIIMWLVVIFAVDAKADDVNIAFDPPTTRTDGTPLSIGEINRFDVYVNDVQAKSVSNDSTNFLIKLDPGNYVVTMISVDTDGRESLKSTELDVNVLSPPLPPNMGAISVTVEVVIN